MSNEITLNPGSVEYFTRTMNEVKSKVYNASYQGVNEAAQLIFNRAQQGVPIQEGALYASGKVTMENNSNNIEAIISYGDITVNTLTGKTTASYAVERHEQPGAGSKWLENAILNSPADYLNILATKIAESM